MRVLGPRTRGTRTLACLAAGYEWGWKLSPLAGASVAVAADENAYR